MAAQTYLVDPKPVPALNIPKSTSTVTVRVIDSTSRITAPIAIFVTGTIDGHTEITNVPAYSFLISNGNRHVLFDLGVPKDIQNGAPATTAMLKRGFTVDVKQNVAEILDDHSSEVGVKSKDVEAVIWSHHHFDHVGDVTTFPKTTDLVVGPGFKKEHTPGYPTNPESGLLEKNWEGRNLREIDIVKEGKGLKIGRCDAMDFFGDGSFYLLDTPGHSVGHMSGLARVTTSPDTFIFMGGDCAHHGGEWRPTEYLPLPTSISPSPIPKFRSGGCPGELLLKIHPKHNATEPFYEVGSGVSYDAREAASSIHKMEEFDAADNVFVIIAHDESLLHELDFFPKKINDWAKKDMAVKSRWLFVKDFAKALEVQS